jgi:hypothetical protein
LEEEKGNPNEMDIFFVSRDTICSFITEYHPPHVRSWRRKDSKIKPVLDVVKPAAHQTCADHGDDQELENKSCSGSNWRGGMLGEEDVHCSPRLHHATEGPSDTQKPHAVAGSGGLLVPNDSGDSDVEEEEGGDELGEGSVEGD